MTLREVRVQARSAAARKQIDSLVVVLLDRANAKEDKCCKVCGLVSPNNEAHFVIPVTYIARCLVASGTWAHLDVLPLRTAFLCYEHQHTFDALFVDPADPHWDLARLERRAGTLGGVMAGSLLVFGGEKALRVTQEFQVSIVALKRCLAR